MTLWEFIRRATGKKYTRTIEAEVVRLRAENRALLNSILGIAGVPPIVVTENDVSPSGGLQAAPAKASTRPIAANSVARLRRVAPQNGSAPTGSDKTVSPMRRRSWHQIYRMLEINSARKKEASEFR